MKSSLLITALALSAMACNAQNNTPAKYTYGTETTKKPVRPALSSTLAESFYFPSIENLAKVDSLFKSLSASEKAAQMIMLASSEKLGYPFATYVKPNMDKGYASGVLFLKGTKDEFKKQEQYLSSKTLNGVAPIFACDCEPTLLHNKFVGEPKMAATATLKSDTNVIHSVDTINKLMDEMNITINFAPIVDIAKNKAIISNRSFGSNNDSIQSLAGTFIQATQNDQKAATIKHFPGHGAVVGDTHKQAVYINGKMTELDNFQKIIDKDHPIFVMVGHISIQNNPEGHNTEDGRPATTSRKIITDLLKTKMGFNGLVTTDAMNMEASKKYGNADWLAAKAGADIILMPANPAELNRLIAQEIQNQSTLGKQFENSVRKILLLKVLTNK